ncbi:hypothetical protein, partial [Pseudoxanthomonas yeongjuensis]|uniref:hypothetical protein n=1 Tax=Pseudoxanthomonas yeongjuensis TaxID=377616 RepID=UPI001B868ADE
RDAAHSVSAMRGPSNVASSPGKTKAVPGERARNPTCPGRTALTRAGYAAPALRTGANQALAEGRNIMTPTAMRAITPAVSSQSSGNGRIHGACVASVTTGKNVRNAIHMKKKKEKVSID